MIEIVYEKEKQKSEGNESFFRIPNNIRQIGEVGGTQRIYIEDYAYTYLCRISSEKLTRGIGAILLGQANWKDGVSYLFIKSAVALPDMEVSEEHLEFTQEIWNHVYEKNKEYFPDQEVVGWFLSIPGCSMELHQVICQTHLDHFGGSDKILFVMEPLEKEEAFYRYEDGRMSRQTGFYVYYEKNEPMHNFLIAQNQKMEKKTEEVDDSAVRNFRKKVEKNTSQEQKKTGFPVMKTAGICAAVAVLAVGVLYLNDYQKLQSAREVIADIDQERQAAGAQETTPVNGGVNQEGSDEQQTEGERASAAEDNEQGAQEEDTDRGEQNQIEEEREENAASGNTGSEQSGENEEEQEDSSRAAGEIHPTYTIQKGDTITKISIKTYGSTEKVREICELNNLSVNDLIYPGQKILLP